MQGDASLYTNLPIAMDNMRIWGQKQVTQTGISDYLSLPEIPAAESTYIATMHIYNTFSATYRVSQAPLH